jgi:hypothetical protein
MFLAIDCGSLTYQNGIFDTLLQFGDISKLCDESILNHEMIQPSRGAGWIAENRRRKIIYSDKITCL